MFVIRKKGTYLFYNKDERNILQSLDNCTVFNKKETGMRSLKITKRRHVLFTDIDISDFEEVEVDILLRN